MVQVKGQRTHSPVGLGVPEAHQCPEDKRQKNQSEVFQDCKPPPQGSSHLPFLQRLQGGQGHPWVLGDLLVRALPVAETGLLKDQPLRTLESYLVTRATGYFPDLRLHSTH